MGKFNPKITIIHKIKIYPSLKKGNMGNMGKLKSQAEPSSKKDRSYDQKQGKFGKLVQMEEETRANKTIQNHPFYPKSNTYQYLPISGQHLGKWKEKNSRNPLMVERRGDTLRFSSIPFHPVFRPVMPFFRFR